jgi:hypothetical protein
LLLLLLLLYSCSAPFASLDLLGLSINGCPTTSLELDTGKRLLLSNTHLKGSNAKELALYGGAALLNRIDQARHTVVAAADAAADVKCSLHRVADFLLGCVARGACRANSSSYSSTSWSMN